MWELNTKHVYSQLTTFHLCDGFFPIKNQSWECRLVFSWYAFFFGVLACLYSLLKNAWNWKRLLSKDLVFFTFTLNVRGVNGKSPLCPKKAAHCMHELVFNLSPVFNLNCPHCSMNHIESMISKALFHSLWFSITWCFQRVGFSFYENWMLPCNKGVSSPFEIDSKIFSRYC